MTGLAEREGMAPVTGGTAFEVSGVTQQAACSVPSCEGGFWGEAVRRTTCRLVIRCKMWTRGACGVTLGAAPHRRRHLHRRAKRGVSEFLRGEVRVHVPSGTDTHREHTASVRTQATRPRQSDCACSPSPTATSSQFFIHTLQDPGGPPNEEHAHHNQRP